MVAMIQFVLSIKFTVIDITAKAQRTPGKWVEFSLRLWRNTTASPKNRQCSCSVFVSFKIRIDAFKKTTKIGNVALWDKLYSTNIFNNLHFLTRSKVERFSHIAGNYNLKFWRYGNCLHDDFSIDKFRVLRYLSSIESLQRPR